MRDRDIWRETDLHTIRNIKRVSHGHRRKQRVGEGEREREK